MGGAFVFGLGYAGQAIARRLTADGFAVAGTCRSVEKAAELRDKSIAAHVFDGTAPMADAATALAGAEAVAVSVPPDEAGDPVLRHHGADIVALAPKRLVYLSTTAVYGDHGGAWIDETAALRATSARGRRRMGAEEAWGRFGAEHGIAVDVLRLSGIYGPGRSPIDALRAGTARRIVKPGHVFNRIHVDDIAEVVAACVAQGLLGATYNVGDDEPAPAAEVVAHAAGLLGVAPPPEVPFEAAEMSEMARSFWSDCKRLSNRRLKERLGVELRYPTYREGLAAIPAAAPVAV